MAAFQYEMGFSPESIDPNSDWYVWLHDGKNIEEGRVSGDVPEQGPGYWDLFRRDHKWAQWLGLNAWRMNPEWSRIFPKSTREVKVTVNRDDEGIKDVEVGEKALESLDKLANERAVKRYEEIFRDIKGRGIKLVLNLYHWPLPLWLHDPIRARDTNLREGPRGWVDEEAVVEFAKFSAYIAWRFGEFVDMWSTFNEPNVTWTLGYMGGNFPPGVNNISGMKAAAVNIVEAHARAFDQIKRIVGRDAKVGVIYAVAPAEPVDDREESREAARKANYVSNLWFMEAVVRGLLDKGFGAATEGPVVRRRDLRDRADWIGVNYYTRVVVEASGDPLGYRIVDNYGFSCKPGRPSAAGRPVSDFGWELYPEGLREAIRMYTSYGKPIAVTENGMADSRDANRPWFLVANLYHLFKAIEEDGANVFGYFHWSLLDNLEWAAGYRMRFGLIHVDMKSKRRAPRPSAFLYRHVIENNGLPGYLLEYAKFPNFLTGPG